MWVPPRRDRRGREAEARARLVSKAIVLAVELGEGRRGPLERRRAEERWRGETEAPRTLGAGSI